MDQRSKLSNWQLPEQKLTLPQFLPRQSSPEKQIPQTNWKLVIPPRLATRLRSALKWWNQRTLIGLFCFTMVFGLASGDALAKGTMGRSGGSFRSAPSPAPAMRSHSSSPSRTYSYSGPRVAARPFPTQVLLRAPPPIIVGPTYPRYGPSIRGGLSGSDVAILTGAGLAIAYGVWSKMEGAQSTSALGPGFSVAKLTVAMNVPERDAPNSILRKLQQLSSMAQTDTRKGVQDLVAAVALELLRQEKNIRSAASTSEHCKQEGDAERRYLHLSMQERSKYEDEREYKLGSIPRKRASQRQDLNATEAVVTILVSIQGDSTRLPSIQSRADLLEALQRIAVDAQVDSCLLSGEISWAPELRSEYLSMDDIYVDYPMLRPV